MTLKVPESIIDPENFQTSKETRELFMLQSEEEDDNDEEDPSNPFERRETRQKKKYEYDD